MKTELSRVVAHRALRLVWVAALTAVALGSGNTARAEDAPRCVYETQLRALTGPAGADLTIAVAGAPGCANVTALKKVQVKTYAADGTADAVRNLIDVPAPGGAAVLKLGQVERNRRVETDVLVQGAEPGRTYVTRGETTTRLRPDLVVAAVHAPAQTLTTRPIDVVVEVSEANGDTAATVTVELAWGPSLLGSKSVDVAARRTEVVRFEGVALTTAAQVELTAHVKGAAPGETDEANNAGTARVDVSEHELVASRVLIPSIAGFGAQFNQHVYAPLPLTGAPPAAFGDLETKVKALEPQLVRIFYNDDWEELRPTAPQNLESFMKTVELAHAAGATINVTYQSAARARFQPDLYMGRFAAILERLVRERGVTNLRWVTVQNEPNGPSVTLTLPEYEALYRALDAHLAARGLRDHIQLMGGDLVESTGARNHRVWLHYIAANMGDVVDAFSEHIYWNYWDIPRMEFRLRDVRKLAEEEIPEHLRKPMYIMEFGVRGATTFPGRPNMAAGAGYWSDGTQTARTNVAAFQQLWFDLASTQLGFTAAVKWDAYWAKYDLGTQAYYMIGPASEGWPLFPAYHATRLLLQTTERGWTALGVEPWTDDDWRVDLADQPEKEIAAFSGPGGELTLLGLDSRGRDLNGASAEKPSYSIGGLPPSTSFNLAIWNAAANGENSFAGTVTTSAAGVARFQVPLHAAFSLTSVPVA